MSKGNSSEQLAEDAVKETVAVSSALTKKLIRQLKILNFWITFFGSLLVIGLIIMALLLFSIFGFIRDTSAKLESAKNQASDSVNIKKQACAGDDGFSKFLRESTAVCD